MRLKPLAMAASLRSWSVDDVASWLSDVEGQHEWAEVMAANNVTGVDLLDMTLEDTQSIGLPVEAYYEVSRLRRLYLSIKQSDYAEPAKSAKPAEPAEPAKSSEPAESNRWVCVPWSRTPFLRQRAPDWPVPAVTEYGDLRCVNRFLREELFGCFKKCRWAVYHNIPHDGDCFFHCVRQALISVRPRATDITVQTLRKMLVAAITNETLDDFRSDYIANAPSSVYVEAYRLFDTPEKMHAVVAGSDHYATLIDIRTVSESVGVHCIVLNNLFRGEHAVDYVRRYCPVLSQTPSRAKYDAEAPESRQYMLLLRNGEHFELVIHADTKVDDATRATLEEKHDVELPTHVFRGVFTHSELPPSLISAYENTMI